ncbi:MAG: DUF5686 and carboxypeptidase regulatory-like domain-containing protein [Lentimicrobium sp.]|nr:DUF5686 and carboxypeptidase regulatory-like domain-containing protein [Lentimicrobium sp.]
MKSLLYILPLVIFNLYSTNGIGQKYVNIKGRVTDAKTKEPLPFVNVVFVGKNIGTITDYNGDYSISTQWASSQLQASFIGYKKQVKPVAQIKSQTINFEIEPESIALTEVVVTGERKRYRNKDNPAVELIKKVIANKDSNSKEMFDYYEFDKHEKVEFARNNITEEFRSKKMLKKFQFVFSFVDTSEINGKPYLPVFLKETLSKVYYRKEPKTKKEYILGTNMVGIHDYIDSEGVGFMIDNLYQDIDIYSNNIILLTNQFISPISTIAPLIYKFHIIDTIVINGLRAINLAFQPRNKADFAFMGNLYITDDDKYAVIKVDMRVTEDINLNFVNDLQIVQEFVKMNGEGWMFSKDELIVDFNLTKKGAGIFGKKTVFYDNYAFNTRRADSIYSGIEHTVKTIGHAARDSSFWEAGRLEKLTRQEQNIFVMVDSIKHVPAFKRTMDVFMLLVAGYWNFGKVEVGPVNTFYSFNDVEGLRLKVGARTSDKFNERLRLEGYLTYGFKDERFKYSGSATWSLNGRPIKENPRHSIKAMYQVETNFPGMEMQFINEDNFLLSFKRGVADKILYYEMFKIEHYRDWGNGFSTIVNFKNMEQKPGGTLYFKYSDYEINSITSSEISTTLRFAPNERFYQGLSYRTPIITKEPIFQLSYTQSIKGLFGADYDYGKASFNVFKRVYLSPIGFMDLELEGSKIFGRGVPFPLLTVHRANQTYSYQLLSYNLMNFLEFVSDQHMSLFAEHHFNGFFFNKIPLIKRLGWREIISFKGVYGSVTDKNNPNVTPGLMLFPTDEFGNTTTYTLEGTPYVEVSAGIGNILKFFRVDYVQRLTHLDNPNVANNGIRVRFKFDF